MLNFRNTNIFFLVMFAFAIVVDVNSDVPVFVYAGLLVSYSLIVFYGCYFVDSNFFLPVLCSAQTAKKEIAISFDDGPAENFTPETLQVLLEQDVKAVFFCIGKRIAGNERMVQQMHAAGHLIGNHSFTHHFWFDLFSPKKMLEDLKHMDSAMEKVIGLRPRLFRPPYGVTNPNLKKAIHQGGYTPVGWSVRSLDTVVRDEKQLLDKMKRALAPGAVFLFHDTSKTTLQMLPAFIRCVKDSGYEIVRLDKLLKLEAYA